MKITLKWGRERFHFLSANEDASLTELRKFVSEQTHLPFDSFKLVFAGGIMKDDRASLTAYGIIEGSTVVIIGSRDKPPKSFVPTFTTSSEVRTEQSCINTINNEVDAVKHTLKPSLDAFLKGPPKAQTDFEFEHRRLGELLLQSLLRLDALSPESHWSDARNHRKLAVKEIQAMLTKLDEAIQKGLGP